MEKKTQLKKISVRNVHPKLRVKKQPIKLLVEKILSSEKTKSGVDVILVDDKLMRQLNKRFTKRDGTTDVLSFGMKEDDTDPIEYPSLGDIYVSLDQAKRQAASYQAEFEQEVALLVAHGLLHLLGYDHREKRQETVMRKKERKYLQGMRDIVKSF
jgi:probable rRNA maturation factor